MLEIGIGDQGEKKGILVGKSKESVGKVGESGEFCVNGIRSGIGCRGSDMVDESVGMWEGSREKLGKRRGEGKIGFWCEGDGGLMLNLRG